MTIEDLLGAGKATEKLLDIIAKGVGGFAAPAQERRMAKAHAETIRTVGAAQLEVDLNREKAITRHNFDTQIMHADTVTAVQERAKKRALAAEVQRQQNLDAVGKFAFAALPKRVSSAPINETWQMRFFSIASDVCDEEMQLLWGKLLAGEVASPGQFSLRTLDVVRNLTTTEANAFQLACSFVVWDANEKNGLVPSMDELPFKNIYRSHGFYFDTALMLQDAGLLLVPQIVINFFPDSGVEQIRISGREFRMHSDEIGKVASIAGMPLTNAGADLFHLAFTSGIEEFIVQAISVLAVTKSGTNLRFEIEEPHGSGNYHAFKPQRNETLQK